MKDELKVLLKNIIPKASNIAITQSSKIVQLHEKV